MTEDLELGELLASHYGQPTPSAEYHALLVRRLQATARAARRRRFWAVGMAAAAGVLLMASAGWWYAAFERTPPGGQPAPAVGSSSPANAGVVVAPFNLGVPDDRMFRSSMKLGDITPAQTLSADALVVRARIDGVNGTIVHYTILRTIFGETDDKSLDQDFTGGNPGMLPLFQKISHDEFVKNNHREPTDAELAAAVLSDHGIVNGAEELLILQQVTGADGKIELRPRSAYALSLDQFENQIVDALQSGTFLDPASLPGDYVSALLVGQHATAVRATLLNVDDHAATWEVTKTILGTMATKTVVIPHDLFRLRAQAIVRHAALADATLKDPKAMAARVDAEMKKLMTEELIPHREAILVLTNCHAQGNDTLADLVERAYEDATHKHLDQVEALLHDSSGTEIRL